MSYMYESEIVKQELANNSRMSKRNFFESRDIVIELGHLENADGSAILSLGKTKVIAGVKMLPDKPFPDNPDEGSISVGIELSPMSDPKFGTGPPDEASIELSRVVDRGLRESKGIDWKSLCIVPGKAVWMIYVDMYIMNNDGNLFDACSLAALAAIKSARVPKLEITDDEVKIVKGEYTENKFDFSNDPLLFTFVKVGDKLLMDPDLIEESASSSRFSVAITSDKKMVSIQKGEDGSFKIDEIKLIVSEAIKNYDVLHKKLMTAMKNSTKNI